MSTYKAYDAIGNEIIIGQRYGFTNNHGMPYDGYDVTIGTASEVTKEHKVLLVNVQRKTFVYSSLESSEFVDVSNVAIFGSKLFPIVSKETILLLNMKS